MTPEIPKQDYYYRDLSPGEISLLNDAISSFKRRPTPAQYDSVMQKIAAIEAPKYRMSVRTQSDLRFAFPTLAEQGVSFAGEWGQWGAVRTPKGRPDPVMPPGWTLMDVPDDKGTRILCPAMPEAFRRIWGDWDRFQDFRRSRIDLDALEMEKMPVHKGTKPVRKPTVYVTDQWPVAAAYASSSPRIQKAGAQKACEGVIFEIVMPNDAVEAGGRVWHAWVDSLQSELDGYIKKGKPISPKSLKMLDGAGLPPVDNKEVAKAAVLKIEMLRKNMPVSKWIEVQKYQRGYAKLIVERVPWENISMVTEYDAKGEIVRETPGGCPPERREEAKKNGRLMYHGSPAVAWRERLDQIDELRRPKAPAAPEIKLSLPIQGELNLPEDISTLQF